MAGNDLGVENSWLWLTGTPVLPNLFYQGQPLPQGSEYNCMLLSYTLSFFGMAQRCTDRWYPICQYSY